MIHQGGGGLLQSAEDFLERHRRTEQAGDPLKSWREQADISSKWPPKIKLFPQHGTHKLPSNAKIYPSASATANLARAPL